VRAVDHRFALSMPALPSAPSKKSFSSVNSPIFAWSAFKSTVGPWSRPWLGPKYSGSPLQNLCFPLRDLVDVHVELLRQLDQRLLAFRAANATFALNAGCGSGVLVSSSSLLIRSHHGRCQAKIPLSPPFKFAEPPLTISRTRSRNSFRRRAPMQ